MPGCIGAVWRCGIDGGEVVPALPPGRMGGHRRRVLEPHRAFIVDRLRREPHLTLHRLKDELAARVISVSHNTVWMFLRREGLRFKKNAVRP